MSNNRYMDTYKSSRELKDARLVLDHELEFFKRDFLYAHAYGYTDIEYDLGNIQLQTFEQVKEYNPFKDLSLQDMKNMEVREKFKSLFSDDDIHLIKKILEK